METNVKNDQIVCFGEIFSNLLLFCNSNLWNSSFTCNSSSPKSSFLKMRHGGTADLAFFNIEVHVEL